MEETFNNAKAYQAQREYCKSIGMPCFAMAQCPRCGADVFKSISVERAGKCMITGCSSCHYSFVD